MHAHTNYGRRVHSRTFPLPDDLPVVERDAVRLVVLDAGGRLLLFHAGDSTAPQLGTCWELPGGGIEAGETPAAAAIRELREESGLAVGVEAVGSPTWRRHATYQYRGRRRLQHELVLLVRLQGRRPEVDASRRDRNERQDCFGSRWWAVREIVDSKERFYPGRLPSLLPALLAGEEIDEPFEVWS